MRAECKNDSSFNNDARRVRCVALISVISIQQRRTLTRIQPARASYTTLKTFDPHAMIRTRAATLGGTAA